MEKNDIRNNIWLDPVVWQKAPDETALIFGETEGLPFISGDDNPMLAIIENDKIVDVIDIINIDGSLNKGCVEGDVTHAGYATSYWQDGNIRLSINHALAKDIMGYSRLMRQIGWSFDYLFIEADSILETIVTDPDVGCDMKDIARCNWDSEYRSEILFRAINAYETYLEFKKTRPFNGILNGFKEDHSGRMVMRLAIYIAMLNPSLNERWDYNYSRQGKSKHIDKISDLEITRDTLLDLFNGIKPTNNNEVISHRLSNLSEHLHHVLILIDECVEFDKSLKVRKVNAVKTAKKKLSEITIPCKKNSNNEKWALFVAIAWGVTPSQVVSAANHISP